MQLTIEYILKMSLLWGLALAAYHFLLRQQRMLLANRIYLLVTMLGVPLALLLIPQFQIEEKVYTYQLAGIAIQESSQAIAQPLQNSWWLWLTIALLGAGLGLVRLLANLWQLRRLFRRAKRESYRGYTILRTADSNDCYTFMGYIVLGDQIGDKELPCMLDHELAHRKLGHSWDILLAEFCCIIFWFHPFSYLYRLYLVEIHEFQADQQVLKSYPIKSYGQLLLKRAMHTQVSLFHTFSKHSQLKKRLIMMTQFDRKPMNKWAYASVLPLLCLFFWALNIQNIQAQTTEEPDEYPYYGDCTGEGDALKKCSMTQLYTAIGKSLDYPESAKKAKKEGKVFVQFVVDKNGKITDTKILKSFDDDCAAEAVRVVQGLNDWHPGIKDGKKVNVKMVLPLMFKLS